MTQQITDEQVRAHPVRRPAAKSDTPRFNVPQESRTKGAHRQHKAARVSKALAEVFAAKPDTIHVDRAGAKLVRGSRY